ncbi:hypothetical protein QQF64_023912 [Cirrhinus molitorella]|uniref:Uncharacterized protein n=1 Tax=Cirrhinus molitorella TaxID=172907 RepID=A0ABR3NJZ3_9TELE
MVRDTETPLDPQMFADLSVDLQMLSSSTEDKKKRFEETGDVFDKPRSGRPRKSTAREDRLLARKSKASLFSTAAELHETWSPDQGPQPAKRMDVGKSGKRWIFQMNLLLNYTIVAANIAGDLLKPTWIRDSPRKQ